MMERQICGSKEFSYQVESVFREYYAPLCYFAGRFVKDEEAVEDMVQDVFAILLERKPVFESAEHLKNFLYLSTKNVCLNQMRHLNTQEQYKENPLLKEGVEQPFLHEIIATEVYRELAASVAGLPAECRKVFELCYFEGMSNEDAAKRLGISVFTVKNQKARGKQILRENLKGLFLMYFLL